MIHDCRNDSVNLFNQFRILLKNVFDTQSAHAVLQFQDQDKQVYNVKNVSLKHGHIDQGGIPRAARGAVH